MIYNPGDILRTDSTGTHVMIIELYTDIEGVEYYRMTPLYDLNQVFMYNSVWAEDKLTLVQKGKQK